MATCWRIRVRARVWGRPGTEALQTGRDVLLLPPRLLGYSTREKLWGQFSVEETRRPPGLQPGKFKHDL